VFNDREIVPKRSDVFKVFKNAAKYEPPDKRTSKRGTKKKS
jgi:hypothetical protein